MELLISTRVSLLFLCLVVLNSCVGKKKHMEMVAALQSEKALLEAQHKVQLDNANAQIDDLTLKLAERKGENNALIGMQDRYEEKIKTLEKAMDELNSEADNEKESLGKTVEEKEKIIAQRDRQIQAVKKILSGDETAVIKLADAVRLALPDLEPDQMIVETSDGRAKITLYEKLMFRTGSVSRLNNSGIETLEKIAGILAEYPGMFITVVGHTDNKPPAIKSYKDNWNFSSLRAATIVRTLVNDFEIGSNQIIAAGKGEFEPNASNSTTEGRSKNRRIELIIAPSLEDQARRIRAALR